MEQASAVGCFGAEQLEAFRRDGYVVVPGMLSPDALAQVRVWTEELVAMPERPGQHMVYYEDSLREPGVRVLSRIENFCPYHPGFGELLNGPEMLGRVAELFGEPAVLFKDKINFKVPGADGFKAHQDVQAGWDTYANLHITALVSIDETTAENGYLELAPGAHRRGLIGERWQPLAEERFPELRYVACPTRPGDAVFFDSYIPHRSGPNRTEHPRRVLYVTYNRRSEGNHRARYYADKRRSYPPDCERQSGRTYVFRV